MAIPVEIHINDQLSKKVMQRADELNISTSEFIRHAIRNEVSRFDRSRTFMREAPRRHAESLAKAVRMSSSDQ